MLLSHVVQLLATNAKSVFCLYFGFTVSLVSENMHASILNMLSTTTVF